jgi:UV DNA damage endonuclease
MRIGYPCINRSIGCTANRTFRIKNYSKNKLKQIVELNLDCLEKILNFNFQNNLLFFRIGSSLIPFASHEVCSFNWQSYFKPRLQKIGNYLFKNGFRISVHPGQYTLLNAINPTVLKRSIKEIKYHCDLLDSMGLDSKAKIQIHVGGVYGDKEASLKRFVRNYKNLSAQIKNRLVIENDDSYYSLKDCLKISRQIKIPIIFDAFHHECLNNGEGIRESIIKVAKTWKKKDGKPMLDYSSQRKRSRKGSHTEKINLKKFRFFLEETKGLDFDIMLEIKDKESSALKAVREIVKLKRI